MTPGTCRFLCQLHYKNCGIDNLNAVEVLERSQMGICGNDLVRLSFQSTGEKFIVGRICGECVRFIGVSRDDGFSENKPKEPSRRFLFWMKSLNNPGISEDSSNLFQDFQGSNKYKLLIYPQVLNSCRQGILGEQAPDKKVGIYHSPWLELQGP